MFLVSLLKQALGKILGEGERMGGAAKGLRSRPGMVRGQLQPHRHTSGDFRHSQVPKFLRKAQPVPVSLYFIRYTDTNSLLICFRRLPVAFVYAAPEPFRTAGTVLARISRSSHNDQVRMYCRSNSIHFSNVVELLPLICQRQVMPGRTLKRLRCQSPQNVSNNS